MPRVKIDDSTRLPGAILLDTHVAIWMATRNAKIKTSSEILRIAYDHDRLFVSVMSAWEIGMLVSKQRLTLPKDPLSWFDEAIRNFRITVLEITPEIAIKSSFLPENFHGDPADRIIVATASCEGATILTADKEILSYSKRGFVNALAC